MTNENDVDLVIRRRKRRLTQQDKRYKRTFVFRLCCLIFFIFSLYLLGAICTSWTGLWGRSLGNAILFPVGGAVVVPTMFISYLLFGVSTGRAIVNLKSQILGSVFLTVSFFILTCFMDMAGSSYRLADPGWLGEALSKGMVGTVGTLGAFLLGFVMLFLSVVIYGVMPLDRDNAKMIVKKAQTMARGIIIKLRHIKIKKRGHGEEDLPMSDIDDFSSEIPKIIVKPTEPSDLSEDFEPQPEREDLDVHLEEEEREEVVTGESLLSQIKPERKVSFSDQTPIDSHSTGKTEHKEEKRSLPMEFFGVENNDFPGNDPMVLRQKGLDIVTALANFGVEAELANAMEGPTVVQYQIQLAPGVKVSKVAGLSKDLAVAMAVQSLRVEAPIPGTSYVGIEVPNKRRRPVTLRSVMESDSFSDCDSILPLPIGLAIDGSPMVIGLEDLPHLLVAGTTGSGKSVFVTSCITALCATRTPSELRFILIDPKRVEMAIYEKLPHVLAKPVVDPHKAVQALGWAVREMERRYEVFARLRVKNLEGYNHKSDDMLPHIVIVVDELADLMFTASKDVEDYICRLAQMARATGIHLILATQRPSVNVITGLIKANIPARAAFTLPSQTDSRTIIDVSGAQQLLGKGDMLFTSTKYPKPVRVQAPFIDEESSFKVIESLREAFGDPKYVELEDPKAKNGNGIGDFMEDERLEEAVRLVMQTGIASASRLQRQMRVGFTRAARMIDIMEQMGIIGPQEGSKPREIYVDEERAEEIIEECRR
ncbi:DNA segregation ATPase FtsK/SpoIIIE, S-DNA-T family [Dethiosulfovibrio salsuginis]|uniref:DNA segregation ATPase FtsK/SpoIIIE, S-DNA-T family n=2 Tax=Dethiosulfovibrio salsuginis TaxID=561720 RepID=A0A1X7I517_9BACT|nr:DNA segregation ATPase FtsK/SpoIIIE, S-DNA-T family [Dethiosulfovibrio salsuginis]